MTIALKNLRTLASISILAVIGSLSAAVLTAGEWKIETVDAAGTGMYTSLKIDASGNAHVAYVPEADGHPLKYAFWDRALNRWFTMRITGPASFCALVLDSTQHPHISFADHGTGLDAKLRHAYWDGEWRVDPIVVQLGAVVAYYTSIAMDSYGKPILSFYDYADPNNAGRLRMRTVFWAGNYWRAVTVDPQRGSGKFNSIAVDSRGNAHLAYANVTYENSGLRYARWNGQAWKTEILEGAAGQTPVLSVAMALDKNDNPHIAYSLAEKGLLKYATRRDGMWQIEAVDMQSAGLPDRNGIALDSVGNPYISYYDAKLGVLKVAYRKNGKWMHEIIDRNYAGFTSSVAIDGDTLWVSYADQGTQSLKVARQTLHQQVSSQEHGTVSAAEGKP